MVTIAVFRPEHGPAFASLNRAWLVGHDLIEAADEPHLNDPMGTIVAAGGQVFVALDDGVVVGTCAIVPHGGDEFEVAKLAVSPVAQGQGIGRRLVDQCVAFARAHGAARVTLLSSTRLASAVRLYERAGFQHKPLPPSNPYVTADVYMELTLQPLREIKPAG